MQVDLNIKSPKNKWNRVIFKLPILCTKKILTVRFTGHLLHVRQPWKFTLTTSPYPGPITVTRTERRLPKVTRLVNGRRQCVNPGPLTPELKFLTSIPSTAFHLQTGYRVHSVSHAQMWTGPNTHQLPNMKKCGSNRAQRATLSHPLWGCYFSFKSTAAMNEGWERRRRGRPRQSCL